MPSVSRKLLSNGSLTISLKTGGASLEKCNGVERRSDYSGRFDAIWPRKLLIRSSLQFTAMPGRRR